MNEIVHYVTVTGIHGAHESTESTRLNSIEWAVMFFLFSAQLFIGGSVFEFEKAENLITLEL